MLGAQRILTATDYAYIMRTFWFFAALAGASPALASPISSPARAVDGDTLILTDLIVRLHGIDAVEAQQTCKRGTVTWPCGQEAKRSLAALVDGKVVECVQRSIDQYGRTVATCTVNGFDLAENLTRSGLAVALPEFSDAYVDAEARSRALRLGIWAGEFQLPRDYRAANPVAQPSAQRAVALRPRRAAAPAVVEVYFRNCAHARAAGAAPLYRGRPGYRPEMDGDSDGVACEPYRGR